jgi:hypothetical protein
MARTKRSETETYVALRIPRELHARLKEASGERGLTAEIISRLEVASGDNMTGELQFEIGRCAELLGQHWVAWHTDAEAWAVFKAAVNHLLDQYKPKPTGTPKSRDAAIMFDGEGAGERLALSVFWHAPVRRN